MKQKPAILADPASSSGGVNGMATAGKNLQTAPPVADAEKAHKMGPIARADDDLDWSALISSLPEAQPTFLSSVHTPPNPCRVWTYGGRKFRCRWPHQLKPWQVAMLHAADHRASELGCPLNVFITIFWEATIPGGAAMGATFRRGMKRMGQWLRDNGVRYAWLFTHENPGNERPNTHAMVHVPRHLRRAFKAKCGTGSRHWTAA